MFYSYDYLVGKSLLFAYTFSDNSLDGRRWEIHCGNKVILDYKEYYYITDDNKLGSKKIVKIIEECVKIYV